MDLVVKDNQLTEACYRLGLPEQRVLLLAAVQTRDRKITLNAETKLEIKAETYAKQFGVSRQAAYIALKEAVDSLWERQATLFLTYKGHPTRCKIRWVSLAEYVDDMAMIRLRFTPELIPLINNLEANFTQYELKEVSGLNSPYAIRIYELIIQWKEAKSMPAIELMELRKRIGVDEEEYPRMTDFKRRVLEPALKQVNAKTDLLVTYDQIKQGRKITHIQFVFKLKRKRTPKITQSYIEKHARPGESYDEAYRRLAEEQGQQRLID